MSNPHTLLNEKILNLKISFLKFFIRKFSEREYIANESNRSESENGLYVSFVQSALKDYKSFKSFKRHPSYRSILEHVSYDDGYKYLEIIKKQSPPYLKEIDRLKQNDLIGNPITHFYEDIGEISPTTLRYIKVASDLQKYFGPDLGKKIVEIGVGYGGQMLVIDRIFKVTEYEMFDLPPVLNLTSKYLESHLLEGSYKTKTLNQCIGNDFFDLAISNYAFSELPSSLQRAYIKKILSKSKRGYLTMNSGADNSAFSRNHLSIYELRKLLPPFDIVPEDPLTSIGNYIIIWGL
jgi:putative sugar O-methyltransferase